MICISWFWSHGKKLFLAKIISGQRSALMCNCIVREMFNRSPWKSSLKVFCYSFWAITLKLLGYVLGIIQKILIEPKFENFLFDFENLGPVIYVACCIKTRNRTLILILFLFLLKTIFANKGQNLKLVTHKLIYWGLESCGTLYHVFSIPWPLTMHFSFLLADISTKFPLV